MAYRRTEHIEARLADNRQRILQSARQLIAEGGFRDTQVAAIAHVAGIATGTVYRYFPSKAELFAEVLRATSGHEVDVVAEIAASGGSAGERLAAAVRAFASRAIRGRRLAYALIAEPVDPEVDAARLEYRRALGKALERVLSEGIADREFPPQDVEASAACLVGALIEGLVGPLAPESSVAPGDSPRLVDAIVTFCIRAVSRPAAEAP